MKMDAKRVAELVASEPADAWVVYAGSREVLEWFAENPFPAHALAGRMTDARIAGVSPHKAPAMRSAVRRLVELGHRRIVSIVRPERVMPNLGLSEQAFLEELESHGIKTGPYNLAVWEGGVAEFHACIDSLFRFTPPTALFLDETNHFLAAQHHLARKRLKAPEEVSLICDDLDPYFGMFVPAISHIAWKTDDLVREVVRWVERIACGKDERRQIHTKSIFVEGGTIGPAGRK
jgi:DNA-binding LacI/PurR family transcriptional regulator